MIEAGGVGRKRIRQSMVCPANEKEPSLFSGL